MIAKRGKEFYDSDEAKFFHSLIDKCLIKPLQSSESSNTPALFLRFLSSIISSTPDNKQS